MRKSVFGFIVTVLVASGALVLQSAFSLQAASREQRPDAPFKFRGKTWKNQLEFIDAGLRCATRQHSEAERFLIDEDVKRILGARGQDKGRPPGGGGAVAAPQRRDYPGLRSRDHEHRESGWRQPGADQRADRRAEQRVRGDTPIPGGLTPSDTRVHVYARWMGSDAQQHLVHLTPNSRPRRR